MSQQKQDLNKLNAVEHFIVNEIKKSFEKDTQNKIGGTSSVNETPYNASNAEYYERSSDYINQRIQEGGNNMSTTEPDPTGDIAVTKSMNSDLARRKITKAIKRLEKAMSNLPDANRASSVSVSTETAPMAKADGDAIETVKLDGNPTKAAKQVTKAMKALNKALGGLPEVGRAASVSVDNKTAPMAKANGDAPNQGTTQDVSGDGDNSIPGNPTVPSSAEPMTKAAGTCSDCGDSCGAEETKCNKCMTKADENTDLEKADSDSDAGTEPDADEDDKSVYKSAQDLISDAKMTKSVWGGAFGAPSIPNVK